MTSVLRPYSVNNTVDQSRAGQRKQRLIELENEQRLEDAEALKITPEQRRILFQSFQSVKVEFSDLDGLSWKDAKFPWSPPGLLPPTRLIPPSFRVQSFASTSAVVQAEPSVSEQALSVSTNTHEDTVRVTSPKSPRPRLTSHFRPSHSAPVVTTISSLSVPSKRSSSPTDLDAETHISKSPRSIPSESPSPPVTPLSNPPDYESDSDRTICGLSDEEHPTTSPRRERKKYQKSRRFNNNRTHRIAATSGAAGQRPLVSHETSSVSPTPGLATSASAPSLSPLASYGMSSRVPFPFLGSHAATTTASN